MKNIIFLMIISNLIFGKANLDKNSLEIIKKNPTLNLVISKYKNLSVKEIIENDLDNDGNSEFIISIYKSKEDFSTFIKSIVVGFKDNKLIEYGELTIGSEKESDRIRENYEAFLNLESLDILKVSENRKYICLSTYGGYRKGRAIYVFENKSLIKVNEQYPANRIGEFTYEVNKNNLYLVDDISKFYTNYNVINKYLVNKNQVLFVDRIVEKIENPKLQFSSNIELHSLIEAKLLGEKLDISAINKKMDVINLDIIPEEGSIYELSSDFENYILSLSSNIFYIKRSGEQFEIYRYKRITTVNSWSHPTKDIFKKYKIKLNEVAVFRTYPIFKVSLNKTFTSKEIKNVMDELFKANSYWDFEIRDEKKDIRYTIKGDKKNKKILKYECSIGGYKVNSF